MAIATQILQKKSTRPNLKYPKGIKKRRVARYLGRMEVLHNKLTPHQKILLTISQFHFYLYLCQRTNLDQ